MEYLGKCFYNSTLFRIYWWNQRCLNEFELHQNYANLNFDKKKDVFEKIIQNLTKTENMEPACYDIGIKNFMNEKA